MTAKSLICQVKSLKGASDVDIELRYSTSEGQQPMLMGLFRDYSRFLGPRELLQDVLYVHQPTR